MLKARSILCNRRVLSNSSAKLWKELWLEVSNIIKLHRLLSCFGVQIFIIWYQSLVFLCLAAVLVVFKLLLQCFLKKKSNCLFFIFVRLLRYIKYIWLLFIYFIFY